MSPVSAASNVIIDYMSPGACKTDIFRDDVGRLQKLVMSIVFGILARTSEVGSRALVDSIRPAIGREAHGAFLWDCKPAESPDVTGGDGPRLQKQFTKELFGVLEGIDPNVVANATP